MITFDRDPVVTESLRQWSARRLAPTDWSSAELRTVASDVHLRSVFSARTTSAEYLQEVDDVIKDLLAGRTNLATARLRLMRKLKQLGYEPESGFPEDWGKVPPAERGSLQDLSSEQRIDFMLKTNLALARNYGRALAGNTEFARHAWPAWRLVRIELRHTPRGTPESHTAGWDRRWSDAGESVGWEGSIRGALVARKDSPIWQALADGVGGYTDTLGHPFPPFAFNSGMDWAAVKRRDWETTLGRSTSSGDPGETPVPQSYTLAPTQEEVAARYAQLSPDLLAVLKERWAA